MSLFKTLLRLQVNTSNTPTEDYLTELFAYCLKQDEALFADFLKHFGIPHGNLDNYYVKTQERFKKLSRHTLDSIPDMTIYYKNHSVFIENKVGATEGWEQLKRYAEHLDQLRGKRTLVYITRDYEGKNQSEIFKNCKRNHGIKFIQLRWHQVFKFLQQYNNNLIISEILKFMYSTGLSSNNQFSPVDILTMTNFSRVRKMMNETLVGKVENKLRKLEGDVKGGSTAMTQLRNFNRYIFHTVKTKMIYIQIGFWFNENESDYPSIKFVLTIDEKSKRKKEFEDILEKIIAENVMNEDVKMKDRWRGFNLKIEGKWSGIEKRMNLKTFLDEEDHIEAIRNQFLSWLEDYEAIRPQIAQYL